MAKCEIYDSANSQWWSLTEYISADKGWKATRNDAEGPNAGRKLVNADMIRDRRAIKYRYDIVCIPVEYEIKETIVRLVEPETYRMRFKEKDSKDWTEREVYTNNFSWNFLFRRSNGDEFYEISFPMIEV